VIEKLPSFPEYKDSGHPWIGAIPAHWRVQRMRHVADMLVSNVDKHTKKGELPVRLCNYVDVYKNERITSRVNFMSASATKGEIDRFRLRQGDVIITKDSEDWNDIGVPALVEYTAPDLVCGYHLAILRPREGVIRGAYLLRALQNPNIAAQFYVRANGVTRYGLSHPAIKSVVIPVPEPTEQEAIVRFLDSTTGQVDYAMRAKRRIISLLNEQKQAIIERVITSGLDHTVPLKASGIPWLGDIPKHWDVLRAKYLFQEVDERSRTGNEELLSVSHLTGVTPRSVKNVTMFKAASYIGHKLCRPGDLVINTMWAWMAALGIANRSGLVSPSYGVYRPVEPRRLIDAYADLLLRTRPYVANYICRSTGIRASRLRLYPEEFLKSPIVIPPPNEQEAVTSAVSAQTGDLNSAIESTEREISLLRQYKTRLIADVATGILDVRDVAASLPNLSETTTWAGEAKSETEPELVLTEGNDD
jgi:type I restriction enzyme S subunit